MRDGWKGLLIVDVDGTLTNPHHRLHWLDKLPAEDFKRSVEWAEFLRLASDDPPMTEVIEAVREKHAEGYYVALVTCRGAEQEAQTMAWMDVNRVPYDILIMREAGDSRDDVTVKRELVIDLLDDMAVSRHDFVTALEDRPSLAIEVFGQLGIPTYLVGEGVEYDTQR